MDDERSTVRRVRTEHVVDDPVAETPVAPVVETAAPPVAEAAPGRVEYRRTVPAEPVYAAAPVHERRDRVVTDTVHVADRPTTLQMARRIVTLLFGILQGLLIIRIILLLLIANRDNEIVQLILGVTAPFVIPFADMFALERVANSSGSILDIGAIVALIGWTLIELLILAILNLGARRSRIETY